MCTVDTVTRDCEEVVSSNVNSVLCKNEVVYEVSIFDYFNFPYPVLFFSYLFPFTLSLTLYSYNIYIIHVGGI